MDMLEAWMDDVLARTFPAQVSQSPSICMRG